jgi:hypothetical protein
MKHRFVYLTRVLSALQVANLLFQSASWPDWYDDASVKTPLDDAVPYHWASSGS